MEIIDTMLPAIFTALGSAIGAGIYGMFTKIAKRKDDEQRKRDEKLFNKIDSIQSAVNILMRYSLQQGAVMSTMLDALKSNHINGNIERAEEQLSNAQIELNTSIMEKRGNHGK